MKFWFLAWLAVWPVLAELNEQDLGSAREIYRSKCSKCHEFYLPSSYTEADWSKWMKKMRRKAHLNERQFQLLSEFTAEMRKSRDLEKQENPFGKTDRSIEKH